MRGSGVFAEIQAGFLQAARQTTGAATVHAQDEHGLAGGGWGLVIGGSGSRDGSWLVTAAEHLD